MGKGGFRNSGQDQTWPLMVYVPCRNTVLSLCLENAELKEQMGEAMSDGWEMEEAKEKGEAMVETVVAKGGLNEKSLQAEFRKLQRKLKNAHNIINLLKEQLVLSSREGDSKLSPELLVHLAREIDRMNTEPVCAPGKHQGQEEEDMTGRPCPRPQSLDLGAALAVDAHQVSVGLDGMKGLWRRAGDVSFFLKQLCLVGPEGLREGHLCTTGSGHNIPHTFRRRKAFATLCHRYFSSN